MAAEAVPVAWQSISGGNQSPIDISRNGCVVWFGLNIVQTLPRHPSNSLFASHVRLLTATTIAITQLVGK
jgi:hypothetical protein